MLFAPVSLDQAKVWKPILLEVIIMDGLLFESVEGLGDSPFVANPAQLWELLQAQREEVSRELLSEGRLCQCAGGGLLESEASEEYTREIRWRHRGQLEARLRDINDAQDRLIDGGYGRCVECAEEIQRNRLLVDPAASLCIGCQRSREEERASNELLGTGLVH